jgi:glycosyltransferase involved in cell wall biosynthesis
VKKDIFIVIPSLSPEGPIKGAVALANALSEKRRVVLAVLKSGPGVFTTINKNIEIIPLYEITSWRKRLAVYKQHLKNSGGKDRAVSISSCFSADLFNLFCRNYAIICSSVRGNLPQNYRLDYGWKGWLLAVGHLLMLRGFHHVVAMTTSMAEQVASFIGRLPVVIGNFVDEGALEPFRCGSRAMEEFRFVFVGSLSARKQPLLVIDALDYLRSQGYAIGADIVGDGPLRSAVEEDLKRRGMTGLVRVHGHLNELHHIVASAEVFILPSSSEGLSRACLEALYLGVPSVLRNVDGNRELIIRGNNGYLFSDDSDLPAQMLLAAKLARTKQCPTASLLPEACRQSFAAQAYLDLVEKNYDRS